MQDCAETLYTGTIPCSEQVKLIKCICVIRAISPFLSDRVTREIKFLCDVQGWPTNGKFIETRCIIQSIKYSNILLPVHVTLMEGNRIPDATDKS